LTAKKVCKETLSAASSPMAIGCLSPRRNYPKNSKLALLKQLSFLNGEYRLSESSADASMGVKR